MRSFNDDRGNRWDAALLSASYGSIMLVFSQAVGDDIRQLLMAEETLADAQETLARLDDSELRKLLSDAQKWGASS